ncbi:MAG: transcription termination/antitermination protein NusG, partial [Actinomycetota bacterium]
MNGSGSISDERDLAQVDSSDTPVAEEGLETAEGSARVDEPAEGVAMEVVEPEPVDPRPDPEPVEPDPEPVEPVPVPVEVDAAEAEAGSVEAAAEPDPEPEPVRAAAEPEPAPVDEDPFRGHGDWYVIHTYSGYENKVKANLESRIKTMQMEGKIFGVHIPMEDVMEIKSGKKQVVKKKQFPGYLLVRMVYDNDSWYVVRNTPGVTGFVSAGTGTKPTPLSKHEVDKILTVKKEEVRPQVRLGFEEGDIVRITSGPFADFNGTISEINPDQAKLKVLVNIFDRETPVELSLDQVAKV